MRLPWSKRIRRVNCRDGTQRDVYKNPDEAFPLLTNNLSAQIKAQVEMLKQLQVNVGVDIKKLVAGFFFQIDEINRSLQLLFRTVYLTYATNPCDLDKWLANQVEKIIEEEIKMRDSIIKLRLKMTQGQEIKDAISEILEEIIAEKKVEISDEVKNMLKKAREWREGVT